MELPPIAPHRFNYRQKGKKVACFVLPTG